MILPRALRLLGYALCAVILTPEIVGRATQGTSPHGAGWLACYGVFVVGFHVGASAPLGARRRWAAIGLLELAGDIELVAEAASGEETVARVVETSPDVLLLDMRMPRGDGLYVLDELARRGARAARRRLHLSRRRLKPGQLVRNANTSVRVAPRLGASGASATVGTKLANRTAERKDAPRSGRAGLVAVVSVHGPESMGLGADNRCILRK